MDGLLLRKKEIEENMKEKEDYLLRGCYCCFYMMGKTCLNADGQGPVEGRRDGKI